MKRAFTLVEILVVIAILGVVLALVVSVIVAARPKANSAQCSAQMRQIGQAIQLYANDYDGSVPPITIVDFVDHRASSPVKWGNLLQTYLPGFAFPRCPTMQLPASMQRFASSPSASGYAYNGWLGSAVKITSSGEQQRTRYVGVSDALLGFSALTVTVLEARPGIVANREPDLAQKLNGLWASDFTAEMEALPVGARRHNNGSNYLFADGHVKWFTPENLTTGRTCDGIHPGFGL